MISIRDTRGRIHGSPEEGVVPVAGMDAFPEAGEVCAGMMATGVVLPGIAPGETFPVSSGPGDIVTVSSGRENPYTSER